MKRYFISLPLFISILSVFVMLQACSSSEITEKRNNKPLGLAVNAAETSLSLADYLRRSAGVYVQNRGTNVSVRLAGVQTVNSYSEPLYVIDGTPLGNSYSMATSIVDVSDIERVQVLKRNAGSAQYGMRGSNGVILIFTKRKN